MSAEANMVYVQFNIKPQIALNLIINDFVTCFYIIIWINLSFIVTNWWQYLIF